MSCGLGRPWPRSVECGLVRQAPPFGVIWGAARGRRLEAVVDGVGGAIGVLVIVRVRGLRQAGYRLLRRDGGRGTCSRVSLGADAFDPFDLCALAGEALAHFLEMRLGEFLKVEAV